MPEATPITSQWEAVLLDCYLSATHLLPLRLRSSFVLIGGAASIFYGSVYRTDDVDVAASSKAILRFHNAIGNGITQFKCKDSFQTIEFYYSRDIVINLELLKVGGGFVDSIAAYELFYDGFIASRTDLLALRGVTVADRGSDGDWRDFHYLLRTTAERRLLLPPLDPTTVEALKEVADNLSWVDALILSSMFREDSLYYSNHFNSKSLL